MTRKFRALLPLLFCTSIVCAQQVSIVSSQGTPSANYSTLKASFDAINAGTHRGIISVNISGNITETASAVLNASGTGSSSYTLMNIHPVGVSSVSGTLAAPLIDLNGADNVTITGINSGGNSLTLQNASTSSTLGTSTVRLINGATNNTVTNCTLQGSSTGTAGAATGVCVIAGGAANTGNTLSNLKVVPAGSNLPSVCIVNVNSTTSNNNLQVLDNEVYDFYSATASQAGIYLGSGSGSATVTGNRIYQTAPRTLSGSTQTIYGIYFFYASSRCIIADNVIGFANATGTGVTSYTATGAMYRPIIGLQRFAGAHEHCRQHDLRDRLHICTRTHHSL
ncbi:MAG: hypothetical protein EOO15_12525 [Chitinophagaceae bacterium]|nr:MAG: hypothetical protein EOO15_12525 [Chitinophagaceae bacterium]